MKKEIRSTSLARFASGSRMSRAAIASALLVALAGCGGGGSGGGFSLGTGSGVATGTTGTGSTATGGSTDGPGSGSTGPTATSTQFSGTAAAGLPLVGFVTVKDAKGATKTAPLVDGNYTVDVTGMTAPFVFRAEGTVGGDKYVIHSAASAADANGTINITPLTDLIVANIAGQIAANYFDSGDFAGLTKDQLDSETAGLKAKLLPVLQAMGVDSSVDLLRTSFTPLVSPLDKALDVLRVSTDPATNVATITNIVTQQQIQDSLATKAAAETAVAPLSGDGMATAPDDVAQIRKLLSDFMANFASGSPSPGALTPYLVDATGNPATGTYNFRMADHTAADFLGDVTTDPNMVGASFTDVVFKQFKLTVDSSNTSPRAYIAFTHKDKNGVAFSRQPNMQVVKGTDGVWRLRGDGRVLDITSGVEAVKDASTGCVYSALQFLISDPNPTNTKSAVAVLVSGPGLPQGGLRYVPAASGGNWVIDSTGMAQLVLATNCSNFPSQGMTDAQIAAIPDQADYVLTAVDSGGNTVQFSGSPVSYKETLTARPLTLAEASVAAYPTVATSTPIDTFSGGSITVSGTGFNKGFLATLRAEIIDQNLGSSSDQADKSPAADGSASAGLSVQVLPGPFTQRSASATSMDPSWRELVMRQQIITVLPPSVL